MMMENAEVESSGSDEEFLGGKGRLRPQIIAKRKRTKRWRLSSSGVYGSVSSSAEAAEETEKDRNYESSITTTTEEEEEEEEEEEYMANCLILLARSGSRRSRISSGHFDDEVGFNESLSSSLKVNKMDTISSFSSLTPNRVNSNAVYECKTCDKAFESFQALGGHRASHHKKPKNLLSDNHTAKVKPPTSNTSAIPPDNKQPSPTSILSYTATNRSSSKVHQCSICGSAFSSGQALGGHMRRHRTTTTAAVVSDSYIRNDDNDNNTNNNFLASLDLNQPAPAEEDQEHEKMIR